MAAKRFGAMKDLAKAKKPRLDVSVTRASTRSSPPRSIMDFWDDDDDVILMATQRAEAEIEAEERKRRAGGAVPNEITFSEFAPTVQGCTSTQQMFPPPQPPAPAPAKKSNALDLEEIFADDDDFDFLAVTLMDSEPQKLPVEPVQPSTSSGSRINIQQKTSSTTTTINFTQSRQQEHQIKFLMDRIEALKRDKSKLEKDLGESNERSEIRSGEVSLLRDELKHLRQQLQVSKMEKLALADETNRDCNKKVAEAAKQVAAKDIELKIKNAEYTKLKTQQRAQAKNMSMNMSMNMSVAPDASEQRTLLQLSRLNIHRSVPRLQRADSGIDFEYDEVRDEDQRQKKRSLFETELKQLLLHYAQLQAQPESLDNLIIPRILASVGKVFVEFASYAQSLKFPPNCTLYPYNPYNLDTEPEVSRLSLTQPGHLFENERAPVLRRYISSLALICRQHKEISSALLEWKHNEEFGILELATEAVVKLGFCSEISEHFGLLEALASLLNSLLLLEEQDIFKDKEEPLFDLLKQLVFTRPSPWVFKELSSCLMSANRQAQLMARMCVKSPRNCFVSDRVRSIYRFAPDSCLLQVYAGLLELCFFSETPLRRDHFQLLLQIGGNHVRFAFECFKNPPDFILEMLPYFADDEEQEPDQATTLQASVSNGSTSASTSTNSHLNSNSSSSQRSSNECECYVKLCLSAVTIVFQMMHQWMLHERRAGTETVGEISRVAVHLMNLIFHEYYLTCLFRDSEETTKHYLSLICSWWREHANILGFQPIQLRLLGRLENSHFMLKPLHQEANPKNPANDLAEWSRIVKDADTQRTNNSAQVSYNCKLLDVDFFAGLKQVDYTFE
ncbi:hypothetical protein KR054_001708 [Drosophila jambulina]|nr:hypothetical protein KR054_001708 [Drosophila jambulina]